jgi:hypothetical protein
MIHTALSLRMRLIMLTILAGEYRTIIVLDLGIERLCEILYSRELNVQGRSEHILIAEHARLSQNIYLPRVEKLHSMATSTASLGWARGIALRADILRIVEMPVFLCPVLARPAARKRQFLSQSTSPNYPSQLSTRLLHSVSHSLPKETHRGPIQNSLQLPRQCAGCGAFSQTSENGKPGFYSLRRRSVKEFLAPASESENAKRLSETEIIEAALWNLGHEARKSLSFNDPAAHCQFSTN